MLNVNITYSNKYINSNPKGYTQIYKPLVFKYCQTFILQNEKKKSLMLNTIVSWYYTQPTANKHDTSSGSKETQQTNNNSSKQVGSPNTPTTTTLTSTTTIDVIPDDIWKSICYFLDYKDFFAINQSCHFFHSLLIKDSPSLNKFWYCQCNDIFYRMEKNYTCKNWYKFFVEMKRLYRVLSIPMKSLKLRQKSKKLRIK